MIALPSAGQTSLDEASEIVRALIAHIVARYSLPALLVVHDPAVWDADARNRHAHVLIGLREVLPEGLPASTKVRDLLGRVRTFKSKNGSFVQFVDGVRFPDLARDVQTRFFAEAGLDLVVDPISPRPGRHWSNAGWAADPAKVRGHLEKMLKQTRMVVLGEPDELLARMLRGRASIPLAEIRHIVGRVIDDTRERAAQVTRIMKHPEIVTIGAPNAPPSHVTTRTVADLLQRSVDGTEQAIAAGRIYVAHASTARGPNKELTRLCRKAINDCGGDPSAIRVVVVGESQSHAVWSLTGTVTETSTTEQFAPAAGRPTVVVLPRAESTADLALADIVVKSLSTNARLVLGFAEDRADGIAARRLAAWIASRAYPRRRRPGADNDAVRLLRCGLVEPALKRLSRAGIVRFGTRRTRAGVDFTVTNDQSTLTSRPRARRPARSPDRALSGKSGILLPNGDQVGVGDYVVLGRTDYSKRPAVLREGAIVRVTRINQTERHIEVQTQTGAKADVDLTVYSELKRADLLSVREGRAIPPDSRLRIEMRTPAHAYAALLLAAKHRGAVSLTVATRVASNLQQLTRVVEASLPGALPSERNPAKRYTFAPELSVAQAAESAPPISDPDAPAADLFDLEDPDMLQPLRTVLAKPLEPNAAKIELPKKAPLPPVLGPVVRGTIADHPTARNTFEIIRDSLAPDALHRQETITRLIERCGAQSPLGRVVRAITRSDKNRSRSKLAKLDLPTILQTLPDGDSLTLFEAYRLRLDLAWAGLYCSGCRLVPKPKRFLAAYKNNGVGAFETADESDGNEPEPFRPGF